MSREKRVDFCEQCRQKSHYTLQKRKVEKQMKDKVYSFEITVAVCDACGEEMGLPELIDRNIQEIDEQYRAYEQIISMEDMKKLMKIYEIGKSPLSLALGFGEITMTRYLDGQIPSKEYSDVMRKALFEPTFMKQKLIENKEKIASTAYTKAMNAALKLEELFCVSEKMLRVIGYLFERLEEVTPLMLQKLLYYTQGVSYVMKKKPMFVEECQAWQHGPVYPEVYQMFKDFKYNPIDDPRFVIFEGTEDALTLEERKIVDLVVDTFGEYGGKVLEKITHQEIPWQQARTGYSKEMGCNEKISKESIKRYFCDKDKEYGFSTEKGIKKYIQTMLKS